MTQKLKPFISPAEHKILLGIGCLIFVFCIVNLTHKSINFYNLEVEKEQQQKLKQANKKSDGKSIDFKLYEISRGLTIYETILILQIFTVPALLFALWKFDNKLSTLNISLFISFFNLFGYLFWIYASYIGRKGNEVFDVATDTFQSYLMINATFLDLILFVCFSVLSITQMFCLLRFVVDKFQAKISLDDKTSST